MSSTTAEDNLQENPLLKDFYFPPFDAIEAKHVRPGIRALLKKLESELIELEKTVEPTWPKLVDPLEKIIDRLTVVWGAVNHLKSVKDTPELRSAIEEVQPEKVEFELKLGQSKPLYNAFKAIRESSDWEALSDARKRIVESQLKEAILNGVSLEDDKKVQFNKFKQELARLSQKFEENVLDATKKFEKLTTDKKEIEGMPASALGLAAQTAVSKGHENATAENGPWVITLDAPSFMAVMQHARNRALREEVYRAYVSRASSGNLDNTAIIDQTLKLRLEKAKLLGYDNYAEVSMATKMATVDKAEELLEKLRSASWNSAVQDMEDLKHFCQTQGAPESNDLKHWDINFWSERLRESKFEINEVETVFHEFGHALQHMLTKQDEGLVAGIRGIEWDAVELPSQFMENWCYHRDTLMSIAKHYETGECLPEDIYRKLLAARTFRAGSLSLRQLRFACVDLELHSKYVPGGSESIYDIDQRVSQRTQVIPPIPEDKFLCSFSHIFAGGYAAGYYSYKWAEVLSADAFSAFEDAGLNDDKAVKETGHRFRETILALGGGKAPLEVFVEFRGREPSPEALLRHNGLLPVSASA
ncbi:hypothetical protein CsSME_00005467 [Camellia sinensis var. sinensis]